MVKYFNILIILFFTMFGWVACSDDSVQAPEAEPYSPGTITLSFQNSVMSRSDDSDNSENLIDNLVIGLYPLSASEDDPATIWKTPSELNGNKNKTITLQLSDDMVKTLFGENPDGKKCRIYALANVKDLEDIEVPEYASISQMKQLIIKSHFKTTKVQSSFVMAGGNDEVEYTAPASSSEKGHASGMVNLTRTAAKIKLNIKLPEKIEIKNEKEEVVETWRPVPNTENGIRVLLNNGVQEAYSVTPEYDEEVDKWKPTNTQAYYDSDLTKNSVRTLKKGSGNYPYTMDVPFYTYPNSWTESVEETHKTTMTLLVPWQKEGESSWNTFYYQVPVTQSEVTFLSSNHYYTVNLEVGILGSLVPDTPLEVDNVSYQIVDWGSKEVDVPIHDYRYLVVNPNVYTFNNEVNMPIPYYTSHPVEITNITISYQRFNFVSDPKNPEVGRVVTFTIDQEQITTTNEKNPNEPICSSSLSKTADQEYVNIYHPLNLWTPYDKNGNLVHLSGHNKDYNELDFNDEIKITADSIKYYEPIEDDAFSMYTITFTLRHIDKPEYQENVVIYQYPAMYIEADRNPASKCEGNVFVNGYTHNTEQLNNSNYSITGATESPSYGTLKGIGEDHEANNNNPNMYIINVTSLSNNDSFKVREGEEVTEYHYIIGDPRSKVIKNALNTSYINSNQPELGWRNLAISASTAEASANRCASANALYDGKGRTSRRLLYYYNTIEDGSVLNMIAPQFRIASSWGTTGRITRPFARYRAALYQENAFPAGRWRIPTLAEFSYINKLSEEAKIPQLFTSGVPYWTSEGLYMAKDGEVIRYDLLAPDDDKVHGEKQGRYSAVRAVYDEWYWSEYPQYSITPDANGNYTYTLGDVPRGAQ